MCGHQWTPGRGLRRSCHATGYPRAIYEGEVDPPAEEEEGDGHQGYGHGVLHQGREMVSAPRGADFVQTESDMDQEHEDDRHPIIEFGEDRNRCVYVTPHRVSPPFEQGPAKLPVQGIDSP